MGNEESKSVSTKTDEYEGTNVQVIYRGLSLSPYLFWIQFIEKNIQNACESLLLKDIPEEVIKIQDK